MTNVDRLPALVLKRKAVVYVRQSTQAQMQMNIESQRRQYELVEEAKRRGFGDIEVIDDDLGRSASGAVARPGFERLVALLCAGEVGAVLCLDASRLARNGRDWHHLLELCGLVEARVIDLDGVYDPCRANDRLLLGMKGSISEFELNVLRTRMLDAKHDKARRGELRISVLVGYIWHRDADLGLDPNLRLQEVIRKRQFRPLLSPPSEQPNIACRSTPECTSCPTSPSPPNTGNNISLPGKPAASRKPITARSTAWFRIPSGTGRRNSPLCRHLPLKLPSRSPPSSRSRSWRRRKRIGCQMLLPILAWRRSPCMSAAATVSICCRDSIPRPCARHWPSCGNRRCSTLRRNRFGWLRERRTCANRSKA